MKPYNFKLTRDRLRLLDRAVSKFPGWSECYFATPEAVRPCVLLAFWSYRCKRIRPASEAALWETMCDECDRRLSQTDAEALSRMIPVEAEEERRHYDRLATRIRTDGGRKCKAMLEVIRTGITNWRTEDRPLLERTLEVAMKCDWRDLAVEDLFCAVVGDESYRRRLASVYATGRGSVDRDLGLARFWDREAEKYAELVATGKVPRYVSNVPPPSP